MKPENNQPIPNRTAIRYQDQATYQKVLRHLSDINDRITEDDIRNVKIGVMPTPAFTPESGPKAEIINAENT